jgi:pimeloyl-ACP methyl ester carboxylesterase
MSYGHTADLIAGALSRFLHVRRAEHNTVGDLDRYLDLPVERMFPEPPPLRDVELKRSLIDRATGTTTLSWRSSHEVLCPRYRVRHESEYSANLTAWARWLRPDRVERSACLIYVHGWLEPGSWAEETTLFRKWVRELGVDIVHVALPFHGPRKPRSALFSGEFFWTADLVRSVEGVRQAVCDVRAVSAYLRARGYSQIGVTGISLGGAITMLLACLEPAPDYIAPIVAHLQLEDAVERAPILWRMKQDLDRWGIHEDDRRRLFERVGWSHYGPKLAPERQLWIQAREDAYIDAALVEKQWAEWGRPPILWIEGGHMTFPLHIDAITNRIDTFRRAL